MSIETFEEAKDILESKVRLSFDDSFELARFCSYHLNNGHAHQARDLVIRSLQNSENIQAEAINIWNDIIEASGLYPYLDPSLSNGSSLLRYEYHRSKVLDNVILHSEQRDISFDLQSGNSVVLSAPTSFGKSLLIEELVASIKYNNIVIVQPTIALLDETRKKLKKYNTHYKIIVTTSQEPSKQNNVFLFTAERVVEYALFEEVDFFIIDEFYKLSLSRDDERAIVLNHAFYKLQKFTKSFYMLGPMIRKVPDEFSEKFLFKWYHTSFQTVAVDEKDITLPLKVKIEKKQEILFELLDGLQTQTIVYCSSQNRASDLALRYSEWKQDRSLEQITINREIHDICNWISENIHPEWGAVHALKKRIAFHHGAVPRHLGSTIVDLFNKADIDILFCTSTLIEGVNTAAKNVVLFDKKKGPKVIDYFDYKNIAGRSGRMNRHYIGNVYRFHPEPTQLELDVDIPIVTQEHAPLELLVQLDRDEIIDANNIVLNRFFDSDDETQQIVKLNSGINVEGQLDLINEMMSNPDKYNKYLSWRRIPTYDQLNYTNKLLWDYLLKKKDSKAGVFSSEQLTFLTYNYNRYKSLHALIKMEIESDFWIKRFPNRADRINRVTNYILAVSRNWFDFRLPKLLTALNNIQNYVFKKSSLPIGEYKYFASQLENSFLSPSLSAVMEFDIPASAVKKIEHLVVGKDIDEILETLNKTDLTRYGLTNYELNKLNQL